MKTVQAIHAGWIIPVDQPGIVLDAHTLVIEDDTIAAIVPTATWRREPEATEIDLRGHALVPGFVNAHTHAAMSLFRGMADDLPLMTWLENHIWPTEARVVGREFVREGTRLAAAEILSRDEGFSVSSHLAKLPYKHAQRHRKLADALLLAGLPQ